MERIMHFEIMVDDVERAKQFYADVFDWKYEDYSEYVNETYWGIITGEPETPGINGGLLVRREPLTEGSGANAFVCTIVVSNYDESEKKILASGGTLKQGKTALPGMAWQGYYYDTEGNLFGIHEPDEQAR